jgi:hypothetical protein
MKTISSQSLVEVVFKEGDQQYTVRRYDEDGNMYRTARHYYRVWSAGKEIAEEHAPRGIVTQAKSVLLRRWAEFCDQHPEGRYQRDRGW